MRVVFLTHNYPRFEGDLPGAFVATLAEALTARGHEVVVVAPSDGGNVGAPNLRGVKIRRVRYASAARETVAYRGTMREAVRTPHGLMALAGLWRALRRATREELAGGASVVHAHWWIPSGLAAPPEAPLVVTVHGTDARMLESSAMAMLARPLFRRARVVTAVSSAMAARVHARTGREVPASAVQPMPADTGRLRATTGGGGVVVVARLTRQKRVDLAIRAIAELRRRGRPLSLTIVGDGPERGALERLTGELELAKLVRFRGLASPDQVADCLATADAMLFPAEQEGFGLSAAEAVIAGVPVVGCRDGGGVADIAREPGAGLLAEPEPGHLADALVSVLDGPYRGRNTPLAGARWRERLAPDHVAAVCEAWYREALHAA